MRIYFYTDGTAIKVGTSCDENRRKKELQTGNPRSLLLLGIIETKATTESSIKNLLKEWQCPGGTEWFRGEPVVKFVAQCLNTHVNIIRTYIKKTRQEPGLRVVGV